MLIDYTMWSSNRFCCIQLFPGFFIVQDFSGSRFFWVQVFQGTGFSESRFFRVQVFQGPDPGSWSRVWVQVLEAAKFLVNLLVKFLKGFLFLWDLRILYNTKLNFLCSFTKELWWNLIYFFIISLQKQMFCADSKIKWWLTSRAHTIFWGDFLKKISLLDWFLGLRGQFD